MILYFHNDAECRTEENADEGFEVPVVPYKDYAKLKAQYEEATGKQNEQDDRNENNH